MCRCRSDGPNQECGSGSCGRYRIAVGDCRRRLHRSQVHRQSRGDADYSIRYQINLATLNAALNGNPQELDGLNAFVDNLVKDTLRQVCAVTITGYSSPDGPLKFNEALAAKRAGDFKAYVDRKYDFSKSTR